LPIDRVNGQPLGSAQGVIVVTPGTAVPDSFSPGSYCTLTSAEALHRPPFDILTAGVALLPAAAALAPDVVDDRSVDVIVILGGKQQDPLRSTRTDVAWLTELVMSSRRGPALSDATPLVTATREEWATVVPWGGSSKGYTSATTAHQFARQQGGVAVAAADADATVSLAGV